MKIAKIGRFRAKQAELMGWTQPSVSNPASVGQGGLNDHHEEAREGPKMDIRTLGIDLAKRAKLLGFELVDRSSGEVLLNPVS
jgi:hypothetical protein